MPRFHRILLEIFAPPFLGVAIYYPLFLWNGNYEDPWVLLYIVPLFFGFCGYAYIIAGIPSLIYAAIMELAFFIGLSPRSGVTVLLSGFLGLVAGVAMSLYFDMSARFFGLNGLVVGLAIGVSVKRFSLANKVSAVACIP
jgi:hypothetical protein